MIEVIYKEEKQEAKNGENLFNLPRNIRQVGLTTGNMRIYIEDYVYTFLTRLARNAVGSGKEQGCVAVFTGETKWNNGITYLFIRGALMVEDMEAASDHIDFSEKIWAKIQEDQAKYFPGQEITGWFFSRPQMYMETDELIEEIIEEMQEQVENKYQSALYKICPCYAEKHSLTEQSTELVVREPHHQHTEKIYIRN